MRRTIRWHLLHAFHNMVAHPLLPFAEALDELNMHRTADVLFRLHDVTTPQSDKRNRHVYF